MWKKLKFRRQYYELRLYNKRSRKSPIKQVIREHTRMYCGLHQSEYSHQVEAIPLTTKPDQSGLKRESFLANTHWKQLANYRFLKCVFNLGKN